MAGKRAARLRSVTDVSVYLAKTINRLDRDEISESKAGKLGYLCNILKSALEIGDLERRVEALEAMENETEQWQGHSGSKTA